MKLEICANSFQSAKNAQTAGAHRIELCTELSVGGITPSYGVLKKVAKEISIPVNVLIRPRSGNFCYTNKEFEIMKLNIQLCKEFGFHGIVSGILHDDNSLDVKRTSELIQLSKPLSFTFHRAFDDVKNPQETLVQLIDLGVDRVLTSGLKESAIDGLDLLKELQEIVKNKLIILPGSGINAKNAKVFINSGFKEIHASASKKINPKKSYFGKPQTVSEITEIQSILKEIQ